MQLIKPTALLASFLAAASFAAAELRVTTPSASNWWVAKSTNVLEWTCKETQLPNFTVLIANDQLLPQGIAIIAIQNNYDCSILITQDQANQPAGTGYHVLLANPVNNTDVWARSEEFEIKPLGSLYPSQQASASASIASASAAAASSSAKATGTKSSAAVSVRAAGGLVAGAVGVVGGLFAGLL